MSVQIDHHIVINDSSINVEDSNVANQQQPEFLNTDSQQVDLGQDNPQPVVPLIAHVVPPNPPVPPQPSLLSNIAYHLLKLFIVIVAVILGTVALRVLLSMDTMQSRILHPNFEDYRDQFGKTYSSKNEQTFREFVYYKRMQEISKHNVDNTQTYKMGVNEFSDLTKEEFRNLYLTVQAIASAKKYIPFNKTKDPSDEDFGEASKNQIYPDVNWTFLLPSIKNQYHCSSCYSFPITAAVEALYAQLANNGTVYSFSQQELIDCASQQGKGCSAGNIQKGFSYIIQNGIHEEKEYTYRSKDGNSFKCSIRPGSPFKISELINIPRGKCSAIESVLNTGPVVVKMDAQNWVQYKEGIFDNCGRVPNHALLVVGRTKEYWLVRNSWGKSWGEYGYIRLAKGNTCGLCDAASHPIINPVIDPIIDPITDPIIINGTIKRK